MYMYTCTCVRERLHDVFELEKDWGTREREERERRGREAEREGGRE